MACPSDVVVVENGKRLLPIGYRHLLGKSMQWIFAMPMSAIQYAMDICNAMSVDALVQCRQHLHHRCTRRGAGGGGVDAFWKKSQGIHNFRFLHFYKQFFQKFVWGSFVIPITHIHLPYVS